MDTSSATIQDQIDRSATHHNLALRCWESFEQSGELEQLEKSIEHDRAALALRPEDHPDRSDTLNNLAVSLSTRYERCGQIEDLGKAIKLHRAALELRSESHPDRSLSLSNLASLLSTQYDQHGRIADLEEAIGLHRAALRLRPEDHPDRPVSLTNLASSLHTRYEQHGRTKDLEEAIELEQAALEFCPKGHPDHSISLNNLANYVHTRFKQNGKTEDLEKAIALHRAVLDPRPKGHPDCSLSLGNLATSLLSRFEHYGRIEDLEETIELERAALELFPKGHPDCSMSLGNLAISLSSRYGQHGRIEDLEEAIELKRAALELRQEGHPYRSISLSNLAVSLHVRYEQHRRTEDLEEAIELHRASLDLCPEGHPARSISLGNLGNSLHTRYEKHRRTEDLEEAIELQRAALELRPKSHPDHSLSLSELAISLSTRYGQHGRTEDLEAAIKLYRAALELIPKGHPLRSINLSNVAESLYLRYEKHGSTKDLEESIGFHRTALELRPEGHPLRSMSLMNLGYSLYARIKLQWRGEEFEECMQLLELAATHKFSGLSERLLAARRWAELARLHNHDTTFSAYSATISILQHALTINPTLHAQHDFLIENNDHRMLILEAASFATEKNNLEQAIEILEQGRGLLWSQLRGFRTPLDQLAETNSELAERFRNVSRQLENLATSHNVSMSAPTISGSRPLGLEVKTQRASFDKLLALKRQLSNEQDEIVSKIRSVSGFENFLKVTPFKSLQQVAIEGPVIMVNHCRYRSDAIVILSHGASLVECVPLDNEFYSDSIQLCNELLETRRQFRADSPEYDKKLCEAMKMLWDRVVSKVIEKLRKCGIVEGSRIWWCPTSVLSVLPFHAAGPFMDSEGTKKYLLDDYVSSYTPTLGALIKARLGGAEKEPKILIIGDLTDVSSLRSAKREIHNIGNSGMETKKMLITNSQKISPDIVIKALQKTTWIHFVCHGHLGSNPFNSSFNLSDGGLTLLDIVQRSLPKAEFAFLSACHTAEQPHGGAHDEVLHLAAAMQFSGFRGVIGSMWELLDEDGPAFAKTIYGHINDCEEGKVKYKRAAGGLQKAALELKARNDIPTERWVNFVHIGA